MIHVISYSLKRTNNVENDIRYTPFDHEELAKVACETMNARNCTLIEKFEEGMSYLLIRGLLCSFVNGLQDLTTKLFV
jgi:hypothetical protein